MDEYNKYLPLIVAAVVILVVGFLNPKFLQKEYSCPCPDASVPVQMVGVPNYMWLALLGLVAGLLVEMMQ
jgi:hypothetical protein